jgi:pyruvate/2-oxoglutarate dehydrogenase complex dihydrolipoamide dehydrogenase (E3) component
MTVQILPQDPHDGQLLSYVHPPQWQNPTPASRYNLVVIGAGTAGLVSAGGAAILGGRVALIERDLMGGDCLNVGCVPSKALLRSARARAQVYEASRLGVHVPGPVHVDFPSVMERMRRLRASLSPNDSAQRFRSLGVDVFLGEGRFTGPDTVEVAGQTLHFRRAVIATGARAQRPSIPGLAEVGFLTNETVFALTELPRRLVVIGAGPVGCELAQAFARFGSQVHLLDHHDRVLFREDPEASARLQSAFLHDGVQLHLGSEVSAVTRHTEGKALHVRSAKGNQEIVADEILVGAGREPNVEGLGLEAAKVQYDPRKGVVVNDRLQTSNRRIYAAGDVCSRYQFTHAADAMARIVIQNALFLGRARLSALTIPWCTYTDPEVARVGLLEREAKEQNIPVQVFTQELHDVDRAVLDGETEGFVKVLVRAGSDRLVGATVVAAHAGEMISELTLAMTAGLGLRKLGATIHAYPTQIEAIKKIADDYNRTRLTPWVKRLLEKWLAWRR